MNCSDCKTTMIQRTYNAAKTGVTMRKVWLCPRCDAGAARPQLEGLGTADGRGTE